MAKKPTATEAPQTTSTPATPESGGSYIVENGVRRRVEEPTADHPDGNMNRDADGKPLGYDGKPLAAADAKKE